MPTSTLLADPSHSGFLLAQSQVPVGSARVGFLAVERMRVRHLQVVASLPSSSAVEKACNNCRVDNDRRLGVMGESVLSNAVDMRLPTRGGTDPEAVADSASSSATLQVRMVLGPGAV